METTLPLRIAHYKSPINEYDFVAVTIGRVDVPVVSYQGRLCYVESEQRVRHVNKAWGFHTRCVVRFLDTNEALSLPATAFYKASKTVPLDVVKKS